jgi:hypothetical protein
MDFLGLSHGDTRRSKSKASESRKSAMTNNELVIPSLLFKARIRIFWCSPSQLKRALETIGYSALEKTVTARMFVRENHGLFE